jgi:hypothetical protein
MRKTQSTYKAPKIPSTVHYAPQEFLLQILREPPFPSDDILWLNSLFGTTSFFFPQAKLGFLLLFHT